MPQKNNSVENLITQTKKNGHEKMGIWSGIVRENFRKFQNLKFVETVLVPTIFMSPTLQEGKRQKL